MHKHDGTEGRYLSHLWVQTLLMGPPVPFTLPVDELRAAIAAAGDEPHGDASAAPQGSDPASTAPSLAKAPTRNAQGSAR